MKHQPSPATQPRQAVPTRQDVSQRTIVILVIITVILSCINAWAGISAMTHATPAAGEQTAQDPTAAQLTFIINKPAPTVDTTTGIVALTIETSG